VGRGLRALVEEDPNLELVAHDLGTEQLDRVLAAEEPHVAILNFGSLRSPIEVRELHARHGRTRLIVLAHRPSPADCNQMPPFGTSTASSACVPAASWRRWTRPPAERAPYRSRSASARSPGDRRPRPAGHGDAAARRNGIG